MAKQRFLPDDAITLPLTEIQGDILIGLQKKAQVFLFFEITDVAAFRRDFGTILRDVTFADATKEVEESHPGPFLSLNVAFSAAGLAKCFPIPDPNVFGAAFVQGNRARAAGLGDDLGQWLPAYAQPIDGVLLVTGISVKSTEDQADGFVNALRHGVKIVRKELGFVRAAQPGHEHNGFADGVSQPGIKGLTLPGAKPDQGWPGQDLVEPGDFIFGPYDREAGGQSTPPLPWMKNGSFMVFRRLRQDVSGFWGWVNGHVAASGSTSADQLGARLVGRWIDGSPLVLDPAAPNPARDETHPETNNDFQFGDADPNQAACPFAAHIRKVYPRDDLADDASEQRRIIRAGIPFGQDNEADKGLLFVCYQTSIEDKFEFLQGTWANNPAFVFGKSTSDGAPLPRPGQDPIIGQPPPGDLDFTTVSTKPVKLSGIPQFVTATGGGYFFSPSRTALTEIAGS